MKVFFDGGCRPNPGMIEIAVVAAGRTTIVPDAGVGTSMDAEWLALIHALTIAQSLGTPNVILMGDAANVIAAVNGVLKCRGAALRHLARFRTLAGTARPPRIRYIKRTQNLAGIALAKLHPR